MDFDALKERQVRAAKAGSLPFLVFWRGCSRGRWRAQGAPGARQQPAVRLSRGCLCIGWRSRASCWGAAQWRPGASSGACPARPPSRLPPACPPPPSTVAVGPGHRRGDCHGQEHRPHRGHRPPLLLLQARVVRPGGWPSLPLCASVLGCMPRLPSVHVRESRGRVQDLAGAAARLWSAAGRPAPAPRLRWSAPLPCSRPPACPARRSARRAARAPAGCAPPNPARPCCAAPLPRPRSARPAARAPAGCTTS